MSSPNKPSTPPADIHTTVPTTCSVPHTLHGEDLAPVPGYPDYNPVQSLASVENPSETDDIPHDMIERIVSGLAAMGESDEVIAQHMGISPRTLARRYAHWLHWGRHRALAQIATGLYARAVKGDLTAQIFLSKVRLGWRESTQVDVRHSITPIININLTDPATLSAVINPVMPDNSTYRASTDRPVLSTKSEKETLD